jgi:hypothetical protein
VDGKTTCTVNFCKWSIFTIFNPTAKESNSTVAEESRTKLLDSGSCWSVLKYSTVLCPLPHLVLFSNKRRWLSRQPEWGLWMRLIFKTLAKHDLWLPNKQQGQTTVLKTWDFNSYQLLLSSPLCMRNATGSPSGALVIQGYLWIIAP